MMGIDTDRVICDDVLDRLGAGGRGGRDVRPLPRSHVLLHGLPGGPQGVYRCGRRRDRQHPRRHARRPPHRARRVVRGRLHRRAVVGHRRLRPPHPASCSSVQPGSSAHTPSRRYDATTPTLPLPEPARGGRSRPRSASTRGLPNRRIARLEKRGFFGSRHAGGTPRRIRSSCFVFVAVAATLPFWPRTGDLFGYGLYTLLYDRSPSGSTSTVGFAGLLDLGYVAFFGIGAYVYALVSSAHYGIHWPTWLRVPRSRCSTALIGLGLGFPSRRLLGDYLAIVTLFFSRCSSCSRTRRTLVDRRTTGSRAAPSGIAQRRSAPDLRPRPHDGQAAVLVLPGRRVAVVSGRPLLREPVPNGARLARARGRTRSRPR